MVASSREHKCRGDAENFAASVNKLAKQIRKAQVKADRLADGAARRVGRANLVACEQPVRLTAMYLAGDVEIEQVPLAVTGQDHPARIDEQAGVEAFASNGRPLAVATRHERNAQPPCQIAKPRARRTGNRFGGCENLRGPAEAEKHFGQDDELHPPAAACSTKVTAARRFAALSSLDDICTAAARNEATIVISATSPTRGQTDRESGSLNGCATASAEVRTR